MEAIDKPGASHGDQTAQLHAATQRRAADSRVYAYPRPGSTVEDVLKELRRAILNWTPPGYVPSECHSAPPPRPNYGQRARE